MSNKQRELEHERKKISDSMQRITQLQGDLMKNSLGPSVKQTRLEHEVEKAQRLTEKFQEDLNKTQIAFKKAQDAFDKAQKDHADAQDKATRVGGVYLQVNTRLQEEVERNQHDQKKERLKISSEINGEQNKLRAWEINVRNIERNLLLEQTMSQKPANNNRTPRQNRYVA